MFGVFLLSFGWFFCFFNLQFDIKKKSLGKRTSIKTSKLIQMISIQYQKQLLEPICRLNFERCLPLPNCKAMQSLLYPPANGVPFQCPFRVPVSTEGESISKAMLSGDGRGAQTSSGVFLVFSVVLEPSEKLASKEQKNTRNGGVPLLVVYC